MNQQRPEQVRQYLHYLLLVVVVVGLFQEVGVGKMLGTATVQQAKQPAE